MARLGRMDGSGHTTLAEWAAADTVQLEAAAELVILRRPIAGG